MIKYTEKEQMIKIAKKKQDHNSKRIYNDIKTNKANKIKLSQQKLTKYVDR